MSAALAASLFLVACEEPTSSSGFRENEYGQWVREVPRSQGTFLGEPIAVAIDRGSAGEQGPQAAERALLEQILAQLPSILKTAEKALADYEEGAARDYEAHIEGPTIWVPKDHRRPAEWTFVVERDDWEDFGWHIEFEGVEFVEIWAGD